MEEVLTKLSKEPLKLKVSKVSLVQVYDKVGPSHIHNTHKFEQSSTDVIDGTFYQRNL